MNKLIKLAEILDKHDEYFLSDKLFKIAQNSKFKILNPNEFNFYRDLIINPSIEMIKGRTLKPVKSKEKVQKLLGQPTEIKKINTTSDSNSNSSSNSSNQYSTGDYKHDIELYKSFVEQASTSEDNSWETKKKTLRDEVAKSPYYSNAQKNAFNSQADRIDLSSTDQEAFDNNYIYNLLKKYKISLEDLDDLDEAKFNEQWVKFVSDLKSKFEMNETMKQYLAKTRAILTAHYTKSA